MNSRKNALVVYFSGTGGTKRVATSFEEALKGREFLVLTHSLDLREWKDYEDNYENMVNQAEYIFLIYAVHAMDAPEPVYDWIKSLPKAIGKKVVVVSVSGGGEVWPNTSCRVYCRKALENKGFDVVYDMMLVMPSNWIVAVNDHLTMWLLKALPLKINKLLDEVFAGKRSKRTFKISSRILRPLSNFEKNSAHRFGKYLKTNEKCNSCGWCASVCPRDNIQMKGGKPQFGGSCILCLRCIYGCPSKAIFVDKAKFIVIKQGFNISEVEKRMKGVELEPVEKCCKGIAWIGIKRYLEGMD